MSKLLFWVVLVWVVLGGAGASANVVRPVPDFAWLGAGAKSGSVQQWRGQPVVVLISTGPRNWSFRRQVGQLQRVYQRLAAAGAICVAAFTRETGAVRSNIPFVLAQDGPRLATLTGTSRLRFAVVLVGKDGNMDCISAQVLSGQRVLDIIHNSFVNQEALRRP